MRQLPLKILNIAITVVLVLAVAVLLRTVFTASGEVPSICGYGFMRTLTGSMEPEIPTNSLVVVKETDPNELQVGDVISFYSTDPSLGGSVNTHRITSISNESGSLVFRTKGDANPTEDRYTVDARNVVGKVVYVSGALGLVVSLLSNPLLFFPVIVVPLVILLILEFRKMLKATAKVAEAEEEAALREAVEALREKKRLEAEATAEAAVEVQSESQAQSNADPEADSNAEYEAGPEPTDEQ